MRAAYIKILLLRDFLPIITLLNTAANNSFRVQSSLLRHQCLLNTIKKHEIAFNKHNDNYNYKSINIKRQTLFNSYRLKIV